MASSSSSLLSASIPLAAQFCSLNGNQNIWHIGNTCNLFDICSTYAVVLRTNSSSSSSPPIPYWGFLKVNQSLLKCPSKDFTSLPHHVPPLGGCKTEQIVATKVLLLATQFSSNHSARVASLRVQHAANRTFSRKERSTLGRHHTGLPKTRVPISDGFSKVKKKERTCSNSRERNEGDANRL